MTDQIELQDVYDYIVNEIESVKNGDQSALEVYPKMNELKKEVDKLRKEIYDDVITEAEKYDKREDIVKGGYKISIQSRARYSYNQDAEYQLLKQKVKNRKQLIKKASEQRKPLTDSETGETVEPVEIRYSTYPVCEWVGEELPVN